MTGQEKAPTLLTRLYHLQGDCKRRILDSSKRVRAQISPLYTKPITSRKPIDSNYALISPKHCELSPWFVADLQIKTNLCCYLRGQHRALTVSRIDVLACLQARATPVIHWLYIMNERAVTMSGILK